MLDNLKSRQYYGYIVYDNGDVYNKFNKKLKPNNVHGYHQLDLRINKKRKQMFVHRLVAECFIENKDNKPCINHINGIKTDNNVENLEWCTHKENQFHAYSTGLNSIRYGENSNGAKLKQEEVSQIRKLYLTGDYTHRELGILFNVSHTLIGYIIRNKIWNHT